MLSEITNNEKKWLDIFFYKNKDNFCDSGYMYINGGLYKGYLMWCCSLVSVAIFT